jgi:hypothetical protein
MSSVSGVVLSISSRDHSLGDDDDNRLPLPVEALNGWLTDQRGDHRVLTELTRHMGGNKHPQLRVFGGGFNYLDEDGFAELVLSQPWEFPENVVLIINPEEGPSRVFSACPLTSPPSPPGTTESTSRA